MEAIGQAFLTALRLIVTGDPEVYSIAFLTLGITIASTLVGAILFIPLGSVIYFNSFPGKRMLVNVIQALFSLPTVLAGLLVFLMLSRAGPLGGLNMLFTPQGMIIGQVVLIAPLMTGLTISALNGISSDVKDTALSLGAGRGQAVLTVISEARFAMVTAVMMGFGRAISEVGAAIIIGGNIRGYTRTLTTAMSLETGMGNIDLSIALGIILLLLALAASILVNRLRRGYAS